MMILPPKLNHIYFLSSSRIRFVRNLKQTFLTSRDYRISMKITRTSYILLSCQTMFPKRNHLSQKHFASRRDTCCLQFPT